VTDSAGMTVKMLRDLEIATIPRNIQRLRMNFA
jgi:hypothetical protein